MYQVSKQPIYSFVFHLTSYCFNKCTSLLPSVSFLSDHLWLVCQPSSFSDKPIEIYQVSKQSIFIFHLTSYCFNKCTSLLPSVIFLSDHLWLVCQPSSFSDKPIEIYQVSKQSIFIFHLTSYCFNKCTSLLPSVIFLSDHLWLVCQPSSFLISQSRSIK